MSNKNLVVVDSVSKRFCRNLKKSLIYGISDIGRELLCKDLSGKALRKAEFWANHNVSFNLERGQCIGLIGHNGAGKTTLLKMLNGLIKPDAGRIEIRGRVGALIALGAGFNPILTGRENVYIAGSILGLTRKEIKKSYDEIVEFADVADFMETPVQNYSSGMQVRLGFSIATTLNPDILLVDEVLAVGDFNFRQKCMNRIRSFVSGGGAAIIVSHAMAHIQSVCSHALYLKHGEVRSSGNLEEAFEMYFDDYDTLTEESDEAHGDFNIRVNLLGAEGGDARLNENGRFVVNVKSKRCLSNVAIKLVILTKNQNIRIASFETPKDKGVDLKIGDNELIYNLDAIPFVAGKYAVRTNIIDLNSGITIYNKGGEGRPDYVDVKENVSNRDFSKNALGELISLNGEWS